MLSNKENINKCIRDLKKVMEAEKAFSQLEVLKNTSNVETLINYALDNNIISSLEDVFYIIAEIPGISEKMASCILKNRNRDKIVGLKHEYLHNDSDRYYGGTYNSIKEAPGYGIEWNERCIPEGVSIRNQNGCRC